MASAQIGLAAGEGGRDVAHGATGKGNDQVRFELGYVALDPDIRVIAPWKMPEFYEKYPGRKELIAYAERAGIPVKAFSGPPCRVPMA